MSSRVNFWPYDHDFLCKVAGTSDADFHREITLYVQGEISHVPELHREWQLAGEIAGSVIDKGFPPIGEFAENDAHLFAARLLVNPCLIRRPWPNMEFSWWQLSESFLSGFFDPFPKLEGDLIWRGRPWFGSKCPEEEYYGTIFRSEARPFVERCIEFRPQYAQFGPESEWFIDSITAVFQFAVDNECDLWFVR